MRPHHPSRALAATAAACVLSVALAGCSGTTKDDSEDDAKGKVHNAEADPDAPLKKGLKISFLPKQINNPYFTVVDKAGIKAAKEFGGTGKEVGPSDAKASSQVSYINTLTQQKQDAILLAANDPNAVCGPLKQAMKQDVKIVSFDSDAGKDCRHVFINQAGSEELARGMISDMADQIDDKGQIAILSATQNATNQNTWIKIMKDELKKPRYKDMKLVKTAYGDDVDQKSFQETQGLLKAYPKLKGIISPTTVGLAAAARYVSGSSYKGKVVLGGLGTPNQMRKFVKDGTVQQFSLWDAEKLGYLGSYAGAALASGQITGKKGETFKAGKLGQYKVGEDGEVILGPPTVFTKKNIDDFDF
ncbi:rhamnose ABC transporter substrate-binding protein [Streptomyces boncukensis]|uniref:Rhamnose ABC transporter substrate-binding protein n=1 Tax=Streptomyces boncukensis TaxID=2711219 RepID=A0A6G4X425_9ACTN|nr:rhamnose ABC transporter substrate-binding protein [Streptomyces boncukensis]NGO72286.1 rhamnose ABC transporter substrate-binding protein [Streptomyces boncukensis]